MIILVLALMFAAQPIQQDPCTVDPHTRCAPIKDEDTKALPPKGLDGTEKPTYRARCVDPELAAQEWEKKHPGKHMTRGVAVTDANRADPRCAPKKSAVEKPGA